MSVARSEKFIFLGYMAVYQNHLLYNCGLMSKMALIDYLD